MGFVSNFSGEKVWFNLFEVIFHINFLLVGSDDNNLSFKVWNFTMKLFHLHCFTKELVFGSSTYATRLNLFLCVFLEGSRIFKEPAGIACYAFEAFSWGCILLEQDMISFLIIFL